MHNDDTLDDMLAFTRYGIALLAAIDANDNAANNEEG